MCRPWLWLWGLVPLMLVVLAALWVRPQPIEQDLAARATTALETAGAAWARLDLDGRDATLIGVAETGDDRAEALDALGRVWGVRTIADATTLPTRVDPFTWSAEWGADRLRLSGHVPSGDARRHVAASADRLFDTDIVVDDMVLARGAPASEEAWPDRADLVLRILSGLTTGTVGMSDLDVRLEGQAASQDTYRALLDMVPGQSLGQGLRLAAIDILPPPVERFLWSASRDGRAVTLAGTAPSMVARAEIGDLAAAAFPGLDVSDRMDVALSDTGPSDLSAAIAFALAQLSGLAQGEIAFDDLAISIEGQAASIADYERIAAALDSLPSPLVLGDVALTPPVVSDFRWEARLTEDALTLSGMIPADMTAEDLSRLAAGRLADVPLTVDLSRVDPEGLDAVDWPVVFGFALDQMARLAEGRVSLTNDRFTISGQARSPESYAAIAMALGDLPDGLDLASDRVRPAAIDDAALVFSETGSDILIEGFFPVPAVRGRILDTIAERFPEARIDDRSGIAEGGMPPDVWPAIGPFIADALAGIDTASIRLGRDGIALDGRARSVADFDRLGALETVAGLAVDSLAVLPPLAESFSWTAEQDVSGHVDVVAIAPSWESAAQFEDGLPETLGAMSATADVAIAEAPDGTRLFSEMTTFSRDMFALLMSGRIVVRDAMVDIEGVVEGFDALTAARALAENGRPAGLALRRLAIEPAAVDVLSWAAIKTGEAITVEGFVPSEAVRRNVLGVLQAGAGDLPVIDRMAITPGGPEAAIWSGATAFAAEQLAALATGRVVLAGTDFSISGTARDAEALAEIAAAVPGGLPGGMRLVTADVAPQRITPYRWAARRGDGSVTVTGFAPDEATRAAIVQRLEATFPSAEIVDDMRLGSGAPANWPAALNVAITRLERLAEGEVAFEGRDLRVTGSAWTDRAGETVRSGVARGLPPGYSGEADITVRPAGEPVDAEACQDLLNAALTGRRILFATGSADIAPNSFALLDELAALSARCPDAVIEIVGHTDATGEDAANLALSRARAGAVVDYLADAGVSAERLRASGHGANRPIASNDTEAGRRQNRRIEFNVVR